MPTRDYAAGCPQVCDDGIDLPPHACPQRISEDCLFLSEHRLEMQTRARAAGGQSRTT